jgi:hypothetical protein
MKQQQSVPIGVIIAVAIVTLALIGFIGYRVLNPDGVASSGPVQYNAKEYEANQKKIEQERSQGQQGQQGQSQGRH